MGKDQIDVAYWIVGLCLVLQGASLFVILIRSTSIRPVLVALFTGASAGLMALVPWSFERAKRHGAEFLVPGHLALIVLATVSVVVLALRLAKVPARNEREKPYNADFKADTKENDD